jgi:hypothetical protein
VAPQKHSPEKAWIVSQTDAKKQMHRRLWIDEKPFSGFWLFRMCLGVHSSGSPIGNSFDEMMQNFELQRDREFSSHVCSDYPRNTSAKN